MPQMMPRALNQRRRRSSVTMQCWRIQRTSGGRSITPSNTKTTRYSCPTGPGKDMWSCKPGTVVYDGYAAGLQSRRPALGPHGRPQAVHAPGADQQLQGWGVRLHAELSPSAPVEKDGRRWLFYSGFTVLHNAPAADHDGRIGLATIRLDGFCSLDATSPGYVLTRPFTWNGSLFASATGRDERRHIERNPPPRRRRRDYPQGGRRSPYPSLPQTATARHPGPRIIAASDRTLYRKFSFKFKDNDNLHC